MKKKVRRRKVKIHQTTAAKKLSEGWPDFHIYCSASSVKARLKSVQFIIFSGRIEMLSVQKLGGRGKQSGKFCG